MPRPRSIIPPVALKLMLPTDVRAKLDFFLFSELEGRVPFGAYQRFFLDRIREFFSSQALDLAPYIGTFPGECIVRGSASTIHLLKEKLANGT